MKLINFYYNFSLKYQIILAVFNNYYLKQYENINSKIIFTGNDESCLMTNYEYIFNKVLKEEFLDIYKRLDKPSKEEKREAYMGAIYKTEEKLGYQLQNIPSNKRMIKIIQKQVDFEKKAKKKIKNK